MTAVTVEAVPAGCADNTTPRHFDKRYHAIHEVLPCYSDIRYQLATPIRLFTTTQYYVRHYYLHTLNTLLLIRLALLITDIIRYYAITTHIDISEFSSFATI